MPFFSNLDHPDSSWVVVTSLPGVLAQFVLFNLVASASVLTLEQKGERRSRACEIERPSIETRKCHFTRLYTVGSFPSSPFACATQRSTGNWHGYYHHKSLSDISLPVCYMQDCSFSRFHKIKLYKLQITVYLTVCISSKREDGGGGGGVRQVRQQSERELTFLISQILLSLVSLWVKTFFLMNDHIRPLQHTLKFNRQRSYFGDIPLFKLIIRDTGIKRGFMSLRLYKKIHYLTREFRLKFQAKTRHRKNSEAMRYREILRGIHE